MVHRPEGRQSTRAFRQRQLQADDCRQQRRPRLLNDPLRTTVSTPGPPLDSAKVNGSTLSVELGDNTPERSGPKWSSSSRLLVTRTARPTRTVGTTTGASIDLSQVQGGASQSPVGLRTQPLRTHVTMNGGKPGNGGGRPIGSGGQRCRRRSSPVTAAVQPGGDWGDDQPSRWRSARW